MCDWKCHKSECEIKVDWKIKTYVYGNTSKFGSVPCICLMPIVMLWASSLAFISAPVNSCELVKGVWYAMNREAWKHKARAI